MSGTDGDSSEREERLYLAIAEYVEARHRGEAPGRQELLERHPDLATELEEFLDNYESFLGFSTQDPETSAPPPELTAEKRIGDYEILEEIARGGMGIVFRARQLSLNRVVALKLILTGQLASREEIQRFRREAESAAQLDHPNIVAVFDSGEHAGLHYLSMQLVEGGSLVTHLPRFAGDPRGAARLIETVSRAVDYAHRRGVLHRDLKPANILIDAAGKPLVSDFGLAKRLDDDVSLTRGALLGTPSYMAPEQAGATRHEVTQATDVYSIGAILYTLLTQQPPFECETPLETVEQVKTREPARPSALNSRLDPDLETICLKCLEKNPHDRYSSAGELADELDRYLAGMPIRARPVSSLELAWRWCRRYPAVSSLGSGVILLLLALTVVSWVLTYRMRESLWHSNLERARRGRVSAAVGQRLQSLEAIATAAEMRPDLRLRNEAIACLALTDLREIEVPVAVGEPRGTVAALDPDSRRAAWWDDAGTITIVRRSDGVVIRTCHALRGPVGYAASLRFSSDGRLLAASDVGLGRRLLQVWDLETGSVLVQLSSRDTNAVAWDISPDTSEIAIGQKDGRVVVKDLSSGRIKKGLALEGQDSVTVVRYRPDGRALAIAMARGGIRVWDLESATVLNTFETQQTMDIAWHPDGAVLAAADVRDVVILDSRWSHNRRMRGHAAGVYRLGFHPSGDLLTSQGFDGTLRIWGPWTDRELLRLPAGRDFFFSANGRWLTVALSDGRLSTWELVRSAEYRVLVDPLVARGFLMNIDVHAGGRVVAVAWRDERETHLFDLSRGEFLASLPAVVCEFVPGEGGLITATRDGLQHWPIRIEKEQVSVGPPESLAIERLPDHGGPDFADLARNGTTVAVVTRRVRGRAFVFDRRSPDERVNLEGPDRLRSIALGPDGRLVAGGTWRGAGVRIWNAQNGEVLEDLAVEGSATVSFSPDGRWLVTSSTGEHRFWDVDTWEPGHGVARERSSANDPAGFRFVTFSPRGDVLAVAHSEMSARLIDTLTGAELATLESPYQQMIGSLCFSPSGRHLLIAGGDGLIEIWDLFRIRRRLAEMGLDWDHPPPPPVEDDEEVEPLQVDVDLGDLEEP